MYQATQLLLAICFFYHLPLRIHGELYVCL